MLWIKAFHIVFMVTWFAGLFYLPRLFVYHAQTADAPGRYRFEVMERRLFVMMTFGAIGTVVFGLWLLLRWWLPIPLWLDIKLALVLLLIIYHLFCYKVIQNFQQGRNHFSARFFRWFNEFPTVILVAIVILVVVKPF